MRRAAAIVGVAIAAPACLLFTDIGGFDAEDAVPLDGGDAALVDTGPADTASGDAGADAAHADAAAGCRGSDAAFCADFDDGILQGRWTFLDPSTGGRTLEISNAVSRSPSSSLRSAIDRAAIDPPPGDCIYARASRNLSDLGARMRARFSFDAWLGAANGSTPSDGALVANLQTSKSCNFIISLRDLACGVVFQFPRPGGTADDGFQSDLALPISNKWTHIDLDLSFDPAAPKWSLWLDGKICGTEKVLPPECQSAQTLNIGPGIYCEDEGTGVAEVYIDNVEVR